MEWLAGILTQGLDFFYGITHSYGLSIILVTLVIRVVLYPLTVANLRALRKMKEMQPEMQAIEKKYKNDPQAKNQAIMELYRTYRVNPLMGCLPLLVQLPFLIAFFRVLHAYEYAGPASFLWVRHLAEPDQFYVLPVLAGITTWWQGRTMPSTDTGGTAGTLQRVMPVLMAVICLRFPAGLTLYWVASNVFAALQHILQASPRVGEGTATR